MLPAKLFRVIVSSSTFEAACDTDMREKFETPLIGVLATEAAGVRFGVRDGVYAELMYGVSMAVVNDDVTEAAVLEEFTGRRGGLWNEPCPPSPNFLRVAMVGKIVVANTLFSLAAPR